MSTADRLAQSSRARTGVCGRVRHSRGWPRLRVPEHLTPGEYVLGFRWDAEETAQVWASCSDVRIVQD